MDDAPALGDERIRVLMLIRNSGEFDTRVRKEAATLAAAGFHVRVLAIASDGLPDREFIGEIEYERIPNRAWLLMAGRERYLRAQEASKARYLTRVAAIRQHRQARLDAHAHRVARIRSWVDAVRARLPRARGITVASKLSVHLSAAMLRRLLVLNRRRLVMAQRRRLAQDRLLRVAWDGYRRGHQRLLPARYHLDYWRSTRQAMERFAPHVVQASGEPALFAALRYARRHGVPLVYDAPELEVHRNTVWTRPKRMIVRVVETLGVHAAAAVITVGPEIADELAATYRISRPAVIFNSPPLGWRQLRTEFSLRAAAGLDESESLVVYVGIVAAKRGLEQLVDALAYMPASCHVGVLGPRKTQEDAELVARAERLGVGGRFHLFEPVPAALVPAALRDADVSVIPIQNNCRSHYLALPNKLFEAVMAGVPVAVGNLVAIRNFVSRHRLGAHFDETDPESIARTVCRLIEEPPPGVRDAESLDALQRSISWEEQGRTLRSIYEHVTRMVTA